jgi:hypothetical protein
VIMQNRYVGDIGDYLKLGVLRALSPGYRMGIAWWLHPDESHNRDGRHIGYLHRPDRWQHYDPKLFDALAQIVSTGERDIRALEAAGLLPGAIHAREMVPIGGQRSERSRERDRWFGRVQSTLADANLVFIDPDNGLEPACYNPGSARADKCVVLTELHELATPGRCLIVYHHQSRRKGGHLCEIVYWAERLRVAGFATVDALRARPYSPRVNFLLNAPFDVQRRAKQLAVDWQGWITWHADAVLREGEILGISSRTDLDAITIG